MKSLRDILSIGMFHIVKYKKSDITAAFIQTNRNSNKTIYLIPDESQHRHSVYGSDESHGDHQRIQQNSLHNHY